MGEVFVGLLLPPAGPHELEDRPQREQVLSCPGRKEVGYAVDRMERPDGLRPNFEREQRDHPVDVDQQQRTALRLRTEDRPVVSQRMALRLRSEGRLVVSQRTALRVRREG